jgi:hypothetical protein
MKATWEGRLMGTFLGYKDRLCYALTDGSRWVQDDRTDEPVYRESPTARPLIDGTGKTYLDVGGRHRWCW